MARAQCALHGRTRCCPSKTRLAAFYKSLRNAGKAPKLALIALARKLLVILTAVLRDKTAFVPSSKIQLPACAGMTMRQAPRFLEPRMLIRGVVDDEIDDDADAALLRRVRELDEIAERAVA